MKRQVEEKLIAWKSSKTRKPLLLQGARQVGKTYLLKKFGEKEFAQCHLIDFIEDKKVKKIFELDLKPERVLRDLGIYLDKNISLEKDLIIFDEIQFCPEALTFLKYFGENYPKAYLCASGSLLGVGLNDQSSSFPVGKVQRLHLYPMTFWEFLEALNQSRLLEAIENASNKKQINELVHDKIWQYLKYYLITGGLPEIVTIFKENKDNLLAACSRVREQQKILIKDYLNDIAKHSGKLKAIKIQAVFENVPTQLARETSGTKKFIFKDVLPGRSNYEYLEGPIEWLQQAGLVHKISICNKAKLPPKAYTDENKFLLYLFDVGLLGAMTELSPKAILNYDYGSYKGYFAENFVLQELIAKWERSFFSWSENTSQIEFLLEQNEQIIPIEVKAGLNTKAKSLSVFRDKYKPKQSAILSGNFQIRHSEDGQQLLPLYLASKLPLAKT